MSIEAAITSGDLSACAARYAEVRRFSEQLSEPLSAEDCAIQSMPDVSPTRWHLAHTTWFFETFVLSQCSNHFKVFNSDYAYLFNSYYNTIGKQYPRSKRGLLSRPGLDEVYKWRRHVDELVLDALRTGDGVTEHTLKLLEVGVHHEQQHQELMLTDIKHVFSCNPLRPSYRDGSFGANRGNHASTLRVDEGIYWIGHDGKGFAFDNETPRHRVFLEEFKLRSALTTCGDYLQFIDQGGYQQPQFWLSAGWQTVCEQDWKAPLYWFQRDGQWYQFTLAGPREVDPQLPVTHVSYFEAEAFARWSQSRLPTEAEWEVASRHGPVDGNFVDNLLATDSAIHPQGAARTDECNVSMFGDVWAWTASPYVPYPGYASPAGALGEYNGKFMCNQYVLRGGSCATASDHVRGSYRNFFPPEARWQFTGFRLCQ